MTSKTPEDFELLKTLSELKVTKVTQDFLLDIADTPFLKKALAFRLKMTPETDEDKIFEMLMDCVAFEESL